METAKPNNLIMGVQLSWESTCPASRGSWVRIPSSPPVTFFEKKLLSLKRKVTKETLQENLQSDGEKAKPYNYAKAINYGGVAQLGEHLPCKQGVMGSNPIISTMGRKSRQIRDLSSITESMLRENSLWVPEIAKRFNEIDAMRISHESPSSPPELQSERKPV